MAPDLKSLIRAIPDFPEPGIVFRDITPLLQDADGFREALGWYVDLYREAGVDAVVGIESRGFIWGAPLADRLGVGLVLVRKTGKLPHHTHQEEYVLEYGTNILEIHQDALVPGQRVAVVDDLLATGGTAAATAKLVELCGAEVHSMAFLIELPDLHGRERLRHYDVASLLTF